jgi:hypothetical protein
MKKFIYLLILVIPFFVINVSAETYTEYANALIEYAETQGNLSDNIILLKYMNGSTMGFYLYDLDTFSKSITKYEEKDNGLYLTLSGQKASFTRYRFLASSGNYLTSNTDTGYTTSFNLCTGFSSCELIYSSVDFMDVSGSVVFEKNYPSSSPEPTPTETPKPSPTPSPSPTDTPEPTPTDKPDVNENCDSVLCDISDKILGEVPEQYNFVKLIFIYLLALVIVLTIVSPLILIFKILGGWW